MRHVADVSEGYSGSSLDSNSGRRKAIFVLVCTYLDIGDALDDWYRCRQDGGRSRWHQGGASNSRWWRRRPQGTQFSFQGKGPDRIAVSTANRSIATRSDGDVLLAVHLVHHRRCVGSKAGLEPPQLFTRLGIQRQEVTVRFTAKDEAASRNRRASPCPNAIRRFVLPGDLVRLDIDRRECAAQV